MATTHNSLLFVIFYFFILINAKKSPPAAVAMYEEMFTPKPHYSFPSLPYKYDELEPHIDSKTVRVHHQKHHKGYTNKMNSALKEWRQEEPDHPLLNTSIVNILQNIDKVPQKWRTSIKNNGGGYINHIYYWITMCPPSSKGIPSTLTVAIEDNFPIKEMMSKFTEKALSLFGSGYVWLVTDVNNNMTIITTKDQDCPLSNYLFPLLTLDVWEHSYYLKHLNMRAHYIDDWWSLVCWEQVEKLRVYWQGDNIKLDEEIQRLLDEL